MYLFESELSENKSIFLALRSIYGIGSYNAYLICKKSGFSTNLKVKDLTKEQINKLIKTVEHCEIQLASDLKKSRALIYKKLISIKSYRGLRKYQGLPIRGQRTHTNARTSRKHR